MIYLLVHGGGSTARFWDRLLPYLDAAVLAVDLPGRRANPADLATITVDDEVASVLADVDRADRDGADAGGAGVDEPIVLVAHSSGGLVVPGVVVGLGGRVARVVLNAALVPMEGACGVDAMQPRHGEGLHRAVDRARHDDTVITLPGPPVDPESARTAYGGDPLDDETLAFSVDPLRCVPDTVHHYFQPVHWSLASDVPVTYVVNERDRPIPAALQEELIARLPRRPAVVRLPGGHCPAITDPEALAAAIRGAGNRSA